MMLLRDRIDAGQKLSKKLMNYRGAKDLIIIGLPRGGVVVAAEVARELRAPLDIIVPRKIGFPENPELALGALSEEGERVLLESFLEVVPEEYLLAETEKEQAEAQRRLRIYRGNRPPLDLSGKTALLVDDGIATGATMRAAILSAKAKGAKRIVVAAPVVAPDTLKVLQKEADEVIYIEAPAAFGAVGSFYASFDQTSDEEVIELLNR